MESWRKKFREMHNIDYLPKTDQNAFEELIVRFKDQHLELMRLDPEIGITHISQDEDGNPLNLNFLALGHPFIFDYRLLPDNFENYEVQSSIMEQMPKEFPEKFWMETYGDVYYSPERYERFVNRKIDKIRKELRSDSMTKKEALNSLTGGFEKHKEWAQNLEKREPWNTRTTLRFLIGC